MTEVREGPAPLDDTQDAQRIVQLEAEVAQLQAQLKTQNQALLTIGGAEHSSLPASDFSILGLEECILLVDEACRVRFVNSEMARLLGYADKHAVLRQHLSAVDSGPLGHGFLHTLCEAARQSSQTTILERSFTTLAPHSSALGLREPATLRFICHSQEKRVQIVVQDVTKLRWLERSFSRYVSPEVITQLMTMPQESLLAVQRVHVTTLFTDLRGFTTVCEGLGPDEACTLLNEHFECVVRPVKELEGTVDKFIGDSMMAVFGAPLVVPDHALRALSAALKMQVRHAEWMTERRARGQAVAEMGIGIATGNVVVGNVGTPERMDYTVLGRAVIIAHRLCSAAKGGEVLTEKTTYEAARAQLQEQQARQQIQDSSIIRSGPALSLPHISFEPAGQMPFKNIAAPVDVIRVTTGAPEGSSCSAAPS